ncbi:hypothetical protein [Mycobacteroides salmoniphilum]|uniref:hypothetical protein n=1 Tax=Mycobacteroides salmoniphilum TaxID=404941 RepID=UPI0012FFCF43
MTPMKSRRAHIPAGLRRALAAAAITAVAVAGWQLNTDSPTGIGVMGLPGATADPTGPTGPTGDPGGMNGGQFQPPGLPPQQPDYRGGINQPPLDQNNGISIYNTGAQGAPQQAGQQGAQQGNPGQQPQHGTQIPDYQTATPHTQGPGKANPDYQAPQQGNQGQQPRQGQQQQPSENSSSDSEGQQNDSNKECQEVAEYLDIAEPVTPTAGGAGQRIGGQIQPSRHNSPGGGCECSGKPAQKQQANDQNGDETEDQNNACGDRAGYSNPLASAPVAQSPDSPYQRGFWLVDWSKTGQIPGSIAIDPNTPGYTGGATVPDINSPSSLKHVYAFRIVGASPAGNPTTLNSGGIDYPAQYMNFSYEMMTYEVLATKNRAGKFAYPLTLSFDWKPVTQEQMAQEIGKYKDVMESDPTHSPFDIPQPGFSKRPFWARPETLYGHYKKHVLEKHEFNSNSPLDYAMEGDKLRDRATSLPTKFDASTCKYFVYDKATNTFGAYNALDWSTRTVFKPTPPDYFDKQPGVIIQR